MGHTVNLRWSTKIIISRIGLTSGFLKNYLPLPFPFGFRNRFFQRQILVFP